MRSLFALLKYVFTRYAFDNSGQQLIPPTGYTRLLTASEDDDLAVSKGGKIPTFSAPRDPISRTYSPYNKPHSLVRQNQPRLQTFAGLFSGCIPRIIGLGPLSPRVFSRISQAPAPHPRAACDMLCSVSHHVHVKVPMLIECDMVLAIRWDGRCTSLVRLHA